MSHFKITNIKCKCKPLIHERKWYRENWIILLICSATVIFGLWLSGGDKVTIITDEPQHPVVKGTHDLESFILNNCDKETQKVWTHVAWYATYQGIKPEVVFAISYADSGCGTNLTTENNPGNIGAFDGGSGGWGYSNMFSGYKALVDTLNNSHLKSNYMIGHLSEGGRRKLNAYHRCHTTPDGWKCYATSIENWSYNTVNALRAIYQNKYLDDTFEFRIK
jgi:hypothetical protein